MAVQFVLGRAGTGKTRYCLDGVIAGLCTERTRPEASVIGPRLILLVPEQASFQMEHALARRAPGGAYTRAEVLSFTRLAQRVFNETGTAARTLAPHARQMALRCVVQRLGDQLGPWQAAAESAGFFAELDRLLAELLREDVSPEALRAAAEQSDDADTLARGRLVGHVLEAYLAWLGRDRIDPAAQQRLLRDLLPKVSWIDGAEIWVDGFADFSGQETATLVELAKRAAAMRITLLLDPASGAVQDPGVALDPLSLFYKTEQTYQRLCRRLMQEGVRVEPPLDVTGPIPPRFSSAAALAALEAGLASAEGPAPRAVQREVGASVRVIACASHRDELREAARFIHRRVKEGRAHYRDFAIIARHLAPLADLAAEVLDEYEIPYFIDARRPLAGHPLVRLIDALLCAIDDDLSLDSMTRLLRTGLLPLTIDQTERLENQMTAFAVHGGKLWSQPWNFEAESRASGAAPADSASAELDAARFQVVAALQVMLGRAMHERPGGRWWAESLLQLLEALHVPRTLSNWIRQAQERQSWEEAEIHRLAWEAVCDALDDVHDVLGETALSTRDVAAVLGGALQEQTLALAPPTLDQVLVSSIDRSRHPDIRHAWLIGMNEGLFPAPAAEGGLLSREQRERLSAAGVGLRRREEDVLGERLLAYIACTRPSESLTISHGAVGEDGGALQPSPLLAEIKRALPGLRYVQSGGAQVLPLPKAGETPAPPEPPATLRELAWAILEAPETSDLSKQRLEAVRTRIERAPGASERFARLLRGATYRNETAAVGPFRRPETTPHGPVWETSASEIETYLQCPFQHFAKYGLRLEAQRGPRHVTWDIGSDVHRILADAMRRALQLGDVRELADAEWLQALAPAIEAHRAELSESFRQRRPHDAFLRELLPALAEDVLLAHAARLRRGEFVPMATEQPLDPLIPLGARFIRLRGSIDRIDARQQRGRTRLLIYDYKSSLKAPTPGAFLVQPWLQIFAYAIAAPALSESGPAQVIGVLLAPLFSDLKAAEAPREHGASLEEQRMIALRPRGRFLLSALGGIDRQVSTTRSPVVFVKLKKDGEPDKYSDTVDESQFAAYLEAARQTLDLAATGVETGDVAIAPLVHRRVLACRHCEYAAVCRFERVYNRPRPAESTLPRVGDAAAADAGEDQE